MNVHKTSNSLLSLPLGAVPGGAGELGELDPLRVRGGLRAAPRQDGHAPPPPGGHLPTGEEHRVGE